MRIVLTILLSALGAFGAITRVQSKSGSVSGGNSLTLTFDNPTASGNSVIVAVGSYFGGVIFTISDNKSNSYTSDRIHSISPDEVYRSSNILGGSSHQVTITPNSGGQYLVAVIVEYSGMDSANPKDQTAEGANSGTAYTTSSVTTTLADELLVGWHRVAADIAWTPASGWTIVREIGDGNHEAILQDRIVSSTGSYASSGVMSSAQNTRDLLVTYNQAAAGVAAPVLRRMIRQ